MICESLIVSVDIQLTILIITMARSKAVILGQRLFCLALTWSTAQVGVLVLPCIYIWSISIADNQFHCHTYVDMS